MKIENRLVYIAEDGTEFDSEEMCERHEKIQYLSKVISSNAYVDEYYTAPIAKLIVDSFDRVKEIVK